MKVVILAASEQEALSYARGAAIAAVDMVIPMRQSHLDGLRLESTDLIAQFYSFVNHPQRAEITDILRRKMAASKDGPPQWVRVGQ